MPADLPSGTVTLLFTDIEGSTRMLQELGRETYVRALTEHRRLLREAFTSHGGIEVEMQGDSFHFAFPYARDAVAAAVAGQRALLDHAWESQPIRVRIGLHTGEPMQADGLYAGLDVHWAARVMSAGHGGQVLLSARTAGLIEGELPVGITLHDLGEHRLKDLTAPQHLFQVGEDEFPPLKTLARRTNLPIAASPLIGREEELGSLLDLIRDGARVVTVTGAGGTGKTRLVIQAAAEVAEDFHDGAIWVPLAGLQDPSLVVPSIEHALGPSGDITTRHALLVLDNFEHLLAAAAPTASLLASAPGLKAVVTSRAPLHVDGEQEFPLDSLDPQAARTLFVERARATGRQVQPDHTVTEICRRLDNLPLALELAAARAKLLAPQALLQRLDHRLPLLTGGRRDAPGRHQTLRATIEWSHELLDREAQQLLARLAVFAGSFSLDAAEQTCGAALETIDALVNNSLLKPVAEDRLLMLETVREFALEQSASSGELEALRKRHGSFFLSLVEEAEQDLRAGGEQVQWLGRLDADQANLREALSWWFDSGDGAGAARFVDAAYPFWEMRLYLREADSWLQRALALGDRCPPDVRAALLFDAGRLARWRGDVDSATRQLEEAAAIFRTSGDDRSTARCLSFLATLSPMGSERAEALSLEAVESADRSGDALARGAALHNRGIVLQGRDDWAGAVACHVEALNHFRSRGRQDGIANALLNLGVIELVRGNLGQAKAYLAESLELASELGDSGWKTQALRFLGHHALATGDVDAAEQSFTAALALARKQEDPELLVGAVKDLAAAAAASGRITRAARLAGSGNALESSLGLPTWNAEQRLWSRSLPTRESYDAAEWRDAWASGSRMSLEDAVTYAVG